MKNMCDNTTYIGVVIPTHNRYGLTVKAINSVLEQKVQPNVQTQIIVVDDGSTDESATKLQEKFKNQITLFVQEQNQGVSAARNRGIFETDCDYYCFLDADDEFLPESISSRLQYFIDNSNENCVTYAGSRKGERILYPLEEFPQGDVLVKYIKDYFINISSFMFPRELFIETGGFDTTLTNLEDVLLIMQMMARADFIPVKKIISSISRQGDSASRNYERIVRQGIGFIESLLKDELLVKKLGNNLKLTKRKTLHELLTSLYKSKNFEGFINRYKTDDVSDDNYFAKWKWKKRYFYSKLKTLIK